MTVESSILAFSAASFKRCKRLAVVGQVDAVVFFEFFDQMIHDALVEIVAAQEGIAAGGTHLEDAIAHIQNGDVEGAAAQVVDRDDFVGLLVEAISQRRSGWLVDDTQHFKAGDLARIFGGVALGIVEIRRDGDDRLCDWSHRDRLRHPL